jgi:hypothetical protein
MSDDKMFKAFVEAMGLKVEDVEPAQRPVNHSPQIPRQQTPEKTPMTATVDDDGEAFMRGFKRACGIED